MSACTEGYPVPEDVSLLPVFRALAGCQQRAEREVTRFAESLGLTASQFEVLAVLGDASGKTCKELSAQSMVTGGTLTPVLDRLQAKGLVVRSRSPDDGRQTITRLTPEGQATYERAFLPLVRHMKTFQQRLSAEEQEQLIALLNTLQQAFDSTSPPERLAPDHHAES